MTSVVWRLRIPSPKLRGDRYVISSPETCLMDSVFKVDVRVCDDEVGVYML